MFFLNYPNLFYHFFDEIMRLISRNLYLTEWFSSYIQKKDDSTTMAEPSFLVVSLSAAYFFFFYTRRLPYSTFFISKEAV